MCGIAGFIGLPFAGSSEQSVIDRMTDSLAHRGPDGRGTLVRSLKVQQGELCVALGHRRLKIIDLSDKARQPMRLQNSDLHISYNGEVYNYVELREELSRLGWNFASQSDTEVVLAAYAQWGTECFKKFNGMWALAIVDFAKNRIILSRDRLGKKPLYYHRSGNLLVFASEIKALLQHPAIRPKPNMKKVFRYLAYNYRYVDIDDESFFEGILQVPAASFMELDFKLRGEVRQYWQVAVDNINQDLTDAEAVEKFRDFFIRSVHLRLRSDVPVGCMLSGGLDSTSITCVAYKILNTPIHTFSGITGDVKGVYDESEYIQAVIDETKAQYHFLRPKPVDLFLTLDEMLRYHDEPVTTITWYSLFLIAKQVAESRIPVLLNGHGGDEIVGGYWDHYHYYFHELRQSGNTAELERETRLWQDNHRRNHEELERSRLYIEKLCRGENSGMERFPDYSSCFTKDFQNRHAERIVLMPKTQPLFANKLKCELELEHIPPSLRPEDRNTMSQSIESRSPMLDYQLIDYCMTLPTRMKMRNGLGKWILRESMKGILPESVRTRKDKAGFIAPADEWFRTILRDKISVMIDSPAFSARGIYNVTEIRRVFAEHLAGQTNHQMFLWQLINLEAWFNKFS